jgi:ubiquinone/menaquinone biosynthesis C-methylase UbiE
MKSPVIDRYDRTAEGHLRWWAPVLAPASARLVERLEALDPGLRGGEPRLVVDIGCGTGSSLFESAPRWPGARLTGLDASTGMLAVAQREAERLPAEARDRISYVAAGADKLPFEDRSFDLAICGFMLQLVPDRVPVLAEMHRVLRPGGTVAILGWIQEKEPPPLEAALETALAETGIVRPPRLEIRSGHFPSARVAAQELRRAGFRRTAAREETLDYTWAIDDFVTYRETTRDRDLFDSLDAPTREKGLAAFDRRLRALPREALRYRPPIVSLVGRA